MFKKTVAHLESFLKGMVFDCASCGQCVLSQTGLICPMSCPKGLRNGPCGGTLHGECEVYPDRKCVWVRIHGKIARDSYELPKLLPSPDVRLFNTSSYLNFLSGEDALGRQPLTYLELPSPRTAQSQQTLSGLETKLKAGLFVKTSEVRAPRSPQLESLREQASHVRDHFDAVNATSFLNGKPSLPSPIVAAELARMGIEAVCQSTCRDHTKTSFISELVQNHLAGVHNILCLTGDSYASVPKIKQVFDMDSSLMIYEARHLREKGIVHFTGQKMVNQPKPFLGGAINPFTEPANVPIRRLKQKVAAGVDFVQTQLIFDIPAFERFMARVRQEQIDRELFIIAGVPVVTSTKALAVLPKIPGVHLPPEVLERLQKASDCRTAGIDLARQTAHSLAAIPGVAGVHLMLFGPDHDVLPEVVKDLPAQRLTTPQASEDILSTANKDLP